MSGTKICLGSLVVALLGLGEIHAQDANYANGNRGMDSNYATGVPGANLNGQTLNATPGPIYGTTQPPGTPALGEPAIGNQMSTWIQYPNSGIGCVPLVDGPITWEIFMRNGVSFNVSGGALGRSIEPGWLIEAGGRSLFFNAAEDEACTVSLYASNVRYNRSSQVVTVAHNFVSNATGTPVTTAGNITLEDLNRTFANLGVGREWYLVGNAQNLGSWSWNVGAEVVAKFGSDDQSYVTVTHLTKDAYGVAGAIYSNIEKPYAGAFFTCGIRLEFDEVWSDILQSQNNSNVSDVNLTFQVGIRF